MKSFVRRPGAVTDAASTPVPGELEPTVTFELDEQPDAEPQLELTGPTLDRVVAPE